MSRRTENMTLEECLAMIAQAVINIRQGREIAVKEGSPIHVALEGILANSDIIKNQCLDQWRFVFNRPILGPSSIAATPEQLDIAHKLGRSAFKEGKSNIPAQNQQLMRILEGSPIGGIGVAIMDEYVAGWNEARQEAE